MSFTAIFAVVTRKANMTLKIHVVCIWDITSRKKSFRSYLYEYVIYTSF